MNRDEARQEVRKNWRYLLATMTDTAAQPVNGETSYICPLCGHGAHGDGLTYNPASRDKTGLKCFGCGFSGDIIDLYQQIESKDYNTALYLLADKLGVTIDQEKTGSQQKPEKRPQSPQVKTEVKTPAEKEKTQQRPDFAQLADFTEYYKQCAARITYPEALEYLQRRGISQKTAQDYGVGFDPAADPANLPGATGGDYRPHPAARIICPTSKSHYVARAINPETPAQFVKINPAKEKGAGSPGIFNYKALHARDVQEIFVTEGFFNALSIIEAGATAIATNSAANVDILLSELKDRPTAATLILAFDNDNGGRTARDKMQEGLKRLNISFIVARRDIIGAGDTDPEIHGGKEDANDLLIKDRAAFVNAVKAQQEAASKPDNTSYYIDNIMSSDIARFKQDIKTGFDNLDKEAGGLYSGLYVLAAISSLGKTTFAAQMADQIAAAGHDVLFFSMEQSRLEMVTKSIARKTYINDPVMAVSSLAIRKGYLPANVLSAAAQYKQEVQDRISIIEGNFNCNISFIGRYIENYTRKNTNKNGNKPVVFIDYLQVLQPELTQNGRQQNTKEAIDSSITELKRISRDLDVTIFVISSVNRQNYLTPIDFEALKESGSIEYTADVIWGLQLQCLNDDLFNKENDIKKKRERVKEAKAATPRKIELSCLKNRYGISNFSAYFNYYPANDYFEPCSEADLDFNPEPAKGQKAGRKL